MFVKTWQEDFSTDDDLTPGRPDAQYLPQDDQVPVQQARHGRRHPESRWTLSPAPEHRQ